MDLTLEINTENNQQMQLKLIRDTKGIYLERVLAVVVYN